MKELGGRKGSGRPKIYTETDDRRIGQLVRFRPLKSVKKFQVDMLDGGSAVLRTTSMDTFTVTFLV